MNARNLEYVMEHNPLPRVAESNDKIISKRKLQKSGIPVPEVYFTLDNYTQLESFDFSKLPISFVLKPNRGLGGQGIVIVYGKKKKSPVWIGVGHEKVSPDMLTDRIESILSGDYSIDSRPDSALIERRVRIHPVLKPYTYKGGIPDIRVIVFNRVPVMAMLRLPTKESGGKGNLALGALGVGIDMATGVTTTAIHQNHVIEKVPGTQLVLSGIQLPKWNDILVMAIKSQVASGLGYCGVDIALDGERGPLVLEVNARPGLKIQLANDDLLRERLQRVEGLNVKTTKKGVRVSQELFGGEVEEELEELSGRKIIGIYEPLILEVPGVTKKKKVEITKKVRVLAKIDTGAYRTAIDVALAEKLNLTGKVIHTKRVRSALGREERTVVKFPYWLKGVKINSHAFIADRSALNHDVIVGRRDLRQFLVDPSKRSTEK